MLEADSPGSARKRPVRQPHQPEQSTQQLGRQAHRAAELLARIRRSILTGRNLEQSKECDHGPLALGTMASWIRWSCRETVGSGRRHGSPGGGMSAGRTVRLAGRCTFPRRGYKERQSA